MGILQSNLDAQKIDDGQSCDASTSVAVARSQNTRTAKPNEASPERTGNGKGPGGSGNNEDSVVNADSLPKAEKEEEDRVGEEAKKKEERNAERKRKRNKKQQKEMEDELAREEAK